MAISKFVCDNLLRCACSRRRVRRLNRAKAVGREKTHYAERRSGELLPRRAREYLPPHSVPFQPEARTMENATVKLARDLDPRHQHTQLSMRQIRTERRVWLGLGIGVVIGSTLGLVLWLWQRVPPAESSSEHDSVPEFGAEAPLTSSPLQLEEPSGGIVEEIDTTDEAPPAPSPVDVTRSAPARRERPASVRPATAKPPRDGEQAPNENRVWIKPESERKVWLK